MPRGRCNSCVLKMTFLRRKLGNVRSFGFLKPIWWHLVTKIRRGHLLDRVPLLEYKHKYGIWASSWDYGTCHIGDQWRLRRTWASVQSHQSICCSHAWSRRRVRPKTRHLAPLDGCAWPHWMGRLKNELTEDKKYHNLMRWLIWCLRTLGRYDVIVINMSHIIK